MPDLADHFMDKAKGLLHDRNHGVLLAGITLAAEMCSIDDNLCDYFREVSQRLDLVSWQF